MTVLLWILAILLVLAGLAGIILPALPGTILIFLGLLLAAWIDHFEKVGWTALVFLGGLTVVSLLLDYAAAAYGVKRFGASKEAMTGSVVGTMVGLFFGIPGVVLGPFMGAIIGELAANRDLLRAGRAGIGTWLGIAFGIAAKLAIAFTMIGIFIVLFIL